MHFVSEDSLYYFRFVVDRFSGEIRSTAALDHETADIHEITVVASDRGSPKSFSTAVKAFIYVLDVNEYAPVFENDTYEVFINSSVSLSDPFLQLKVSALDCSFPRL